MNISILNKTSKRIAIYIISNNTIIEYNPHHSTQSITHITSQYHLSQSHPVLNTTNTLPNTTTKTMPTSTSITTTHHQQKRNQRDIHPDLYAMKVLVSYNEFIQMNDTQMKHDINIPPVQLALYTAPSPLLPPQNHHFITQHYSSHTTHNPK